MSQHIDPTPKQTDLNALNSNSYQVLTPSSGFSGDLRIIRCGKQRVLFGGLKPSSTGAYMTAYTLDSIDRPYITIYAPCSSYGVSAQSDIRVTQSGELQFTVPTNGNGNYLRFNFTYYVS